MALVDNQALVGQLGGQDKEQSGLMKNLLNNTELLSIVLDMIGSQVDPNNPFAGVGSALAKSSLATKAEKEREGKAEGQFEQLIKAITGKDQPGPSDVTISADPSGAGGLAYKITGLEGGQKRLEDVSKPVIRSSEDFLKDFGGGGGF